MGKMSDQTNLDDVIRILTEDNPRMPVDMIRIYASAFRDYQQAEANIAEHGTIVYHPRTGAPIENPYLKVRSGAQSTMLRCKLRNVARVWPKSLRHRVFRRFRRRVFRRFRHAADPLQQRAIRKRDPELRRERKRRERKSRDRNREPQRDLDAD